MMDKVPTYPWFDQVPEGLRTKKQLSEKGLKPGGPVRAQVVWRRGKRWADLYQLDEAQPKRATSQAQREALAQARRKQDEARRTCPVCHQVRPHVIEDTEYGFMCGICEAAQEQAERDGDRSNAILWARQRIQRGRALIMDTETTGLDEAHLVQIAVIDLEGQTLLDTLVDPQVPIPAEATRIHGIRDEHVRGNPRFCELLPTLTRLLYRRTVLIYNAAYDRSVLWAELLRHHDAQIGGCYAAVFRREGRFVTENNDRRQERILRHGACKVCKPCEAYAHSLEDSRFLGLLTPVQRRNDLYRLPPMPSRRSLPSTVLHAGRWLTSARCRPRFGGGNLAVRPVVHTRPVYEPSKKMYDKVDSVETCTTFAACRVSLCPTLVPSSRSQGLSRPMSAYAVASPRSLLESFALSASGSSASDQVLSSLAQRRSEPCSCEARAVNRATMLKAPPLALRRVYEV